MHVISWGSDDLAYEEAYNTYARRIFPWPGVPEPAWGGAWWAVQPGETSTRHSHDEREMYFVVEGTGVLTMGSEERPIGFGDTIFITPNEPHFVTNDGEGRLLLLSIWWDADATPAPAP